MNRNSLEAKNRNEPNIAGSLRITFGIVRFRGISQREDNKKSALSLRLNKRKCFKTGPGRILSKTVKKISKHTKGAFRARKTLQKFGYSVLGHMEALFSEHRPPP